MASVFRTFGHAACLLLLFLGGSARAGDPLEQLDRILAVTADAPAWRPGLFASCQPPTSEDPTLSGLEPWCLRCEEAGPGWSAAFHFFPDPDRGACTLQEVQMSTTMSEASTMEAFGRRLTAASGREPQPVPLAPEDWFWSAEPVGTPEGWLIGGYRAWLYKHRETVGPPSTTLAFLLRRDRLVRLLEERNERVDSTRPARQACREAGSIDCDAAGIAGCPSEAPAAPEAALRRSLANLARTSPDAPSLPAQLYWTQRLGECVAGLAEYPDDSASASEVLTQRFPELGPVDASFGPGGWKGESIEFHSPFRARLLDAFPNTRWGRVVFLEALGQWNGYAEGCDSSGFAPVAETIRRGEAFLKSQPDTETSDDVRFMLAEAYETWWSLSISGSGTGDLFPDDLPMALAGRETARQAALAIYRRLAARPGANLWSKDRIFRLEHNLDTFARHWRCSQC